jgi:serine/threonine-protein kinase
MVVSKGKEPNTTPVDVEKSLSIPLDFDAEEIEVKVVMVRNGESEIVYQKIHLKSEERVSVTVKGSGTATISIYFNDVLVSTQDEVFN